MRTVLFYLTLGNNIEIMAELPTGKRWPARGRARLVPPHVRSSGQGGGEVFWPPVMTPGPQLPDQLGRWHGQHRAAGVSQAVAGDMAMDRAAQPAPSPVTHHQ